jgi:hypothetical protein
VQIQIKTGEKAIFLVGKMWCLTAGIVVDPYLLSDEELSFFLCTFNDKFQWQQRKESLLTWDTPFFPPLSFPD